MKCTFGKKWKGQIGIALCDGGVTLGQCGWKNGAYVQPVVRRIAMHPRELTSADWRESVRSSFAGSECSISLPASFAHHQVLRLPNMTEEELKEAAGWEMADRLDVDRSNLQLDAIRIGTGGDVLAVAIEKQTLSSLLEPLYEAGLQPTIIESQSVSVARTMSMLHRRQSDQAIVRSLLDFGSHDSSFMVLAGDSIMFYKHLEYCGSDLLEAITDHTGVSVEQATQMLNTSACTEEKSDISKVVRDATRTIHESIATDAMKCIRHYGVTNRGPLSTQCIVTGSAGWNTYMAAALSRACNQEVVQDSSVEHIQNISTSITAVPGWHIAFGASVAALQNNQQRRGSDHIAEDAA